MQDGQRKLGGMTASGNLFERNNGGIGIINFLENDAQIEISDILIDNNYFVKTGYRNNFSEDVEESVASIHIWFAGSWDKLANTTISNNVFYFAYPKLINLLNIGEARIDFKGNTYVQGMYNKALTYAPTYETTQEFFAGDEEGFSAAVKDVLGDAAGTVYCRHQELENAEIKRAFELGILTESAPEDLSIVISSGEMTELLARLVAAVNAEKLAEWKECSASAAASGAALTVCDGMLAVYEAALTLGIAERNADYWQTFEQINEDHDVWDELSSLNWEFYPNLSESGTDPDNPDFAFFNCALTFACGRWNSSSNTMIFDYDDAMHTMHGNEPLSWDAAVRACARFADSLDVNNYKYYLGME